MSTTTQTEDTATRQWLRTQVRKVQNTMDFGTDVVLAYLLSETFQKGVDHGRKLEREKASG